MTRGEHSKSLANTERLEEQMRTPENRVATEVVDPEASAGSRRSSLSSVMSPDPATRTSLTVPAHPPPPPAPHPSISRSTDTPPI
ncbi:hypothetical protein CRUP_006328 [Coryphaenoides rupestris]|nr:hypothetical protein CRUP_006328 [Coryphaenoides rupestris]